MNQSPLLLRTKTMGEEYVIEESLTPSDLARKIGEPILSLVALAVLYFYGVDWFLDPVVSFFSQFDWFGAVVAIIDRVSSVLGWIDSLNGDPSLPFGLSLPSERVLDAIVTLVELGIGIAVVVEALNTSILAVRSEGVTIRDVSVPWSSIRQVVIVQPQSSTSESDQVEVGLRLAPDASPPDDLSSLDTDTSTQSDLSTPLCTVIDRQHLDHERLVTVVHGFAPENVSIVEVQEGTERELGPKEESIRAECQTD